MSNLEEIIALDEKIAQKTRDVVSYGYMRGYGESWDACWHEATARKKKLIAERQLLIKNQAQ